MKSQTTQEYTHREVIMNLLSDSEIASVSNAESAERLADGDEYIDLDGLRDGVQHARGNNTIMGQVIPRKAVRELTWGRILTQLDGHNSTTAL
jgi:hypothetical protein